VGVDKFPYLNITKKSMFVTVCKEKKCQNKATAFACVLMSARITDNFF
jgi:hypothetical protein